jgi:hypothetical protein
MANGWVHQQGAPLFECYNEATLIMHVWMDGHHTIDLSIQSMKSSRPRAPAAAVVRSSFMDGHGYFLFSFMDLAVSTHSQEAVFTATIP